ncbi:amidase signature domain-containing protein [Podospora australis]|uniref:Amidase signature domain-containing protein n=1 Tax=Podospora australis TaxID=1536484 RepID=A0AAN6X132_9PEZI|nr:amidase signature domain-containing protein [Podospora australis]
MSQPPQKRFANHPGAKEAPPSTLEYHPQQDNNPALRGLPLMLGSILVSNLPIAQKYLWSNAKFAQPKLAPGLAGVPWRIQPNVIPLDDSSSRGILPLDEPQLVIPQSLDLPGRFHSVSDYHELYKSGLATPLDVVEALLPLITRGPDESKYARAFTQTKPDEVRRAAAESTARWKRGEQIGILDGAPFGVKDDTEVKGYVSTMGMKVDPSFEYFRTPETETVWPAKKMEEMGAIMIGKMNQHEIGMDTTGCNPSTGTAPNWYNTSYFPGGSSAGAGSALCAGLVPITIGTDAGGSMRIPPAFCGVYGLKPTFNRTVSRNSSVCVVGPMTSTVSDLIIAYRVMSQPNPSDPAQNLLGISLPPSPSAPKYLGICRPWIERADPDVLSVFDKALAWLTTKGGYTAVDIKLPYLREGQLAHAATCLTEAADDARSRVSNPSDFLKPLNYPNKVLVGTGSQTPAGDYLSYGQIRQTIMSHLAYLWEKYPGMLVLTPTTPIAGWPITPGDEKYGCSDGNLSIRNMVYAWVANTSGCPAVTVPGGYVPSKQGEGDLPVGIMAMAEWGGEEQLLGWAREMEGYLREEGGRRRPREWVDLVSLAKMKGGGGVEEEGVQK